MTKSPFPSPDDRPPAAALLGRRQLRLDVVSGEAELEFLARPEFANRHGSVQGGILAAMLDSATGSTLMACLPPGFTAVTVQLNTSFLKPAPIGTLNSVVRLLTNDGRDAEVEAELATPLGEVVAHATARFRILRRS